jgi:hypothetical protein
VVRAGAGYRLDLDGDGLGLARFDALVVRARQAEADGHTELAEELLGQALACWRGPVLGGTEPRLTQHPAVVAAAGRRVEAALAYADVAEALGRYERSVKVLRLVADDESLHEALHARLMVALAATGQQATALGVYAAMQRRLAEELGIEPGAQMRAAHLRVLRQQAGAGTAGGDAGDTAGRWEWVRPAQVPRTWQGSPGGRRIWPTWTRWWPTARRRRW